MVSVSLIFAIHKRARPNRKGRGKLRPKNNQFHQVVSMEKGTFANSGKMA